MNFTAVSSRIVLIFFIMALISCTSIGVRLLPKDRAGFNDSMISSEEEQLLLNIVRMRFSDRPYFVSVDSITTSKTLSVGGGANASYSPSHSGSISNTLSPPLALSQNLLNSFSTATSYALNANGSFDDSPTVSFTPLQGEKFTTQILSPIDLRFIYLLLDSGWSIEILFRTVIHHIYGREPFENVSSQHLAGPPDFKKFMELLELLRELRVDGLIYYRLGEITEITLTSEEMRRNKMRQAVERPPAFN